MRRPYSWKVNSPDAAEYEEVCQTQLEPDNIMFREIQSDILTKILQFQRITFEWSVEK